jgi:hypothetical protein
MEHRVVEDCGVTLTSSRLIGEYGLAVDGPTIILMLTSPTAAAWLKDLFLGMIGSAKPVDLATRADVALKGVGKLELVRLGGERRGRLSRARRSADFTWSGNDEEWDTRAQLLDPFVDGLSGHCYLTSFYRDDDARIEVCLAEQKRPVGAAFAWAPA